MKNNKGFTLIELLAVIVILAIIALIATPTILGVIDKAKKGAAQSSVYGYVKAVENQVMINEMDTDDSKKFNLTSEVTYKVSDLDKFGVDVKGDQPKAENAVKINTKGEVEAAALEINGYYVYYDGEKAVADKDKAKLPGYADLTPDYTAPVEPSEA